MCICTSDYTHWRQRCAPTSTSTTSSWPQRWSCRRGRRRSRRSSEALKLLWCASQGSEVADRRLRGKIKWEGDLDAMRRDRMILADTRSGSIICLGSALANVDSSGSMPSSSRSATWSCGDLILVEILPGVRRNEPRSEEIWSRAGIRRAVRRSLPAVRTSTRGRRNDRLANYRASRDLVQALTCPLRTIDVDHRDHGANREPHVRDCCTTTRDFGQPQWQGRHRVTSVAGDERWQRQPRSPR